MDLSPSMYAAMDPSPSMSVSVGGDTVEIGDVRDAVDIRDVWDENLDAEFAVIRDVIDDFPFVSMDTEFPGVVLQPIGEFRTVADQRYQAIRANVDHMHLIQLGLTLFDANGNLPVPPGSERPVVWQFNFREFDVESDTSNPESIELLRRSGIDFQRNREDGIHATRFAELLVPSGAVLEDSVSWVTFHCAYDFAYLIKILTGKKLPETRQNFFEIAKVFFPVLYDIKHLLRYTNNLYGGLNRVAKQMRIERVGISHQAGSDSLLACRMFRKLAESYIPEPIERYAGLMYGLDIEKPLISG